MRSDVARAVAAIRAGELVVVPTDTVYGLACTAFREEPALRLYALKGRDAIQPTALVAASVEALVECLPEVRGGVEAAARAVMPGPYTLVLPNPARRFPWLTGTRPDAIGVRVPDLSGPGMEVLEAVGALVATSANLAGGADPRRVADVPEEILAGVAAVVDDGELPGTPSTVIDLTGSAPTVLRAGAGDEAGGLERIRRALVI